MTNPANESKRTVNEHRLAKRLRQEALATRPVFDEKLHARIMEAVDPWHNPVAIYRDPAPSRLRRAVTSPWLPAAVAASVMLAVGMYAYTARRPAPRMAPIVRYDTSEWLLPVAQPEQVREEAIVVQPAPASRGTPSVMALAVTDPLTGFTMRTSQLPLAAAARLGQLREANNRFAADLVRDQLASLDRDARVAANMLFGTLPMGEEEAGTDALPVEQ